MPDERWLPVEGWPYEIGDIDGIRSVDRILSDGRRHGGGPLTPWRNGEGYLCVTLRDGKRSRTVAVHVLRLETFTGPPPDGKPQGRHLNGDQLDCSLVNLAWGSQAENERDKRRGKGTRRTRGKGKREKKGINREEESTGSRVPTVIEPMDSQVRGHVSL